MGTKTYPSNDCFVVDAGVIVFIESEFDCLDIEQVARAELKTAMDTDDAFDRLDEVIVNVKYVEKSDLELTEVKDVAKGNGAVNDDGVDSVPIYAWVLVGFGSILFVMTLGLIYKTVHHFRSKQVDFQSSDPSSWSTSCIERESSDQHEEEDRNSRCHCEDRRNSHVSFVAVDE